MRPPVAQVHNLAQRVLGDWNVVDGLGSSLAENLENLPIQGPLEVVTPSR